MFKNQVEKNKIFNPKGDDSLENRTIIKGNTTGLFNLNNTKYSWAKGLYQVMIGNFWIPEKVSGLPDDAIFYQNSLTDEEKRAYDGILSFLIFLDSIQTVNLPNLSDYITAPEVNLLLSIQAYQEAIHSQSYATILETVLKGNKKDDIYYFWRNDKILLERNEYIGSIYQNFIDKPSDKNFFKGIVGNFLLEAIYFYNGFAFFDTLADAGKMVATDRMINYIRRDELTHVEIFKNIIKEIKNEFPDIYDEKMIYEMMGVAVEQEIKWSNHILGEKIMGINKESIESYTKFLSNKRLSELGLKPLYEGFDVNPYKHLDRLQDNNSEKGNFFESTIINYSQSSALQGSWDF